MKTHYLTVLFFMVLSNVCFAQNDSSKFIFNFIPLSRGCPIPGIDSAILAKANAGDAESQYQVGMYWLENEWKEKGLSRLLCIPGDEEEHKKALGWFKKAALQGHKSALIEAGIIYYHMMKGFNDKIEWNKKQAKNYLMQGGAEDDPVLMMYLASIASWGQTGSDKESLIWCDKAIARGLPKSEDEIPESRRSYFTTLGGAFYFKALHYLGEKDVPRDHVKYYENLVLAEKNGYREALILIGECYFQGWGVKQDKSRAIEIWNSLKEEYKFEVERMKQEYGCM